jgi:hypothetical protein
MSYDPEDEPLSPEEEAEWQATQARAEAEFEAEATRLYGPPESRAKKNRRYADRLVRRFSEPVVRGLLTALSRLDRPHCAHWLSEMDLAATPIAEIICPFELCGRRFRIASVEGDEYTVEISAGYGLAGDGGRFLIKRGCDGFVIKESLEFWRY